MCTLLFLTIFNVYWTIFFWKMINVGRCRDIHYENYLFVKNYFKFCYFIIDIWWYNQQWQTNYALDNFIKFVSFEFENIKTYSFFFHFIQTFLFIRLSKVSLHLNPREYFSAFILSIKISNFVLNKNISPQECMSECVGISCFHETCCKLFPSFRLKPQIMHSKLLNVT